MSSSAEVEQQNKDIMSDIQNLQNVEMDLFKTLESGIANNSMDLKHQNDMVEQIKNVSNMRENLYKTLNNLQQHYRGAINSPTSVIGHQLNAMNVVEIELNEAKKRLDIIEEEKSNKLRLTEINTFYGSRYENQASIMKTIIMFCIPLIILTLLANYGFLPNSIYVFLFGILSVIAIVIIFRKYLDIISHDNMNYQEYVWGKTPPDHPALDYGKSLEKSPWKIDEIACMAQACCEDGYTWVPGESPLNKCFPNNALPKGVKPYHAPSKTESTPGSVSVNAVLSNNYNKPLSQQLNDGLSSIESSPASLYDSLKGSF